MAKTQRLPHPVIWLILYLPFGALGGFVGVALTFMGTKSGLSITEASLLIASQLMVNWLKWLWAPVVDITLSPKRWYVLSTVLSAVGVVAMSVVPLNEKNLAWLLVIVAAANIVNSIVGMAVETMITRLTPADQVGRNSSWFQSGNLGGAGLGGALGLYLLEHFEAPWISGGAMGILFVLCCLGLLFLPPVANLESGKKPWTAVKDVSVDLWKSLKTPIGILTGLLCALPISTGAAQGTMTQAAVAGFWHAGAEEVALVQGLLSGFITMAGCFMGGWVCDRMSSRLAYAWFGILLALIATGMALSPATVTMYIAWNMIYALGVGLAYAAFTAMVLQAISKNAAATGYNVYASLGNFPIWWVGLLLGLVAEKMGPRNMLFTEAILGVVGVVIFLGVNKIYAKKINLN